MQQVRGGRNWRLEAALGGDAEVVSLQKDSERLKKSKPARNRSDAALPLPHPIPPQQKQLERAVASSPKSVTLAGCSQWSTLKVWITLAPSALNYLDEFTHECSDCGNQVSGFFHCVSNLRMHGRVPPRYFDVV